jgi:hypothetical protein
MRSREFELIVFIVSIHSEVSLAGACFETLALLAPQHEAVVFQQVRPHPEEATKGPSRRIGSNTYLCFQVPVRS